MLKKTLITLAVAVLAATCTYGQGTVNFDLSVFGTGGTQVRVRDLDGLTSIAGTGFLAQLYAAAGSSIPEAGLVAVGKPVFMRVGLGAGWNQISGVGPDGTTPSKAVFVFDAANPAGTPGGPATVQMRVWESGGNNTSTYTDAIAGGRKFGKSNVFTVASTGNPPATPPNLVGIQSFNLQVVPEPSTIGLGILGASALLFLRRRK